VYEYTNVRANPSVCRLVPSPGALITVSNGDEGTTDSLLSGHANEGLNTLEICSRPGEEEGRYPGNCMSLDLPPRCLRYTWYKISRSPAIFVK
jgi:hypothetical protein